MKCVNVLDPGVRDSVHNEKTFQQNPLYLHHNLWMFGGPNSTRGNPIAIIAPDQPERRPAHFTHKYEC
jgi:hypothetical protein